MEFVNDFKSNLARKATDIVQGSADAIEDVSSNPEKLRRALNLWLIPKFMPTFLPEAQAEEIDYHLLGTSSLDNDKKRHVPRRMFDIATGNLVDWLDSDDVSQYCMLSHQWKGCEITLDYVIKARRQNGESVKAGNASGSKSDVEMIYDLCEQEILEHESTILELVKKVAGRESDDVKTLLAEYIEITNFDWKQKSARMDHENAKRQLNRTSLESDAFKSLAHEMEDTVALERAPKQTAQSDQVTDPSAEDVKEAKETAKRAQDNLTAVLKEKAKPEMVKKTKFFQDNILIRDAIRELLDLLQRWKSVAKIQNSLKLAQETLESKPFPPGERRYLWNDTCCINKGDANELGTSLSLMGDWYANADFCLVYLDTGKAQDDWTEEWTRFQQRANGAAVLAEPNYTDFDAVRNKTPEWSTRGWTLQELVLSKMTFYANAAWQPLSRPVDSLGPYYFLVPFIELYVGSQAPKDMNRLRKLWKKTAKSLKPKDSEDASEEEDDDNQGTNEAVQSPTNNDSQPEPPQDTDKRVEAAQNLILILETLGLHIPSNIERSTALPCISQAVYLAATGLRQEVSESDGSSLRFILNYNLHRAIEQDIKHAFPTSQDTNDTPGFSSYEERRLRHMLKFLLQCLVAETKPLIHADRNTIAQFGNIAALTSWQDGLERTKFTTEQVMTLAAHRVCTVETDRVYSLMGLLGVNFPTFAAEGLSRALARLFDEVLALSNDVSLFNWAGSDMGGDIRGRSLYPSSLAAFHTRKDRQPLAMKRLAKLLEERRSGVMQTFQYVDAMLRRTIDFVKAHEHDNVPTHWIMGIIDFIREADFEHLESRLGHLECIIQWVEDQCTKAMETEAKQAQQQKSKRPGFLHRDTVADVAKHPVGSILNGLSGRKRSGSSSLWHPSAKRAKTEDDQRPASPTPSTASTLVDDEEYGMAEFKKDVKRLDGDVMSWLEQSYNAIPTDKTPSLKKNHDIPALPEEIQTRIAELERPILETATEGPAPSRDGADTISPNPIIVTSSGIEGVFDIQRVIITFCEEQRLRNQVRQAASPHQRITGWCSISTGFARVMVSFSCEKHVLEKQLMVSQAVKEKVLEKPPRRKDEMNAKNASANKTDRKAEGDNDSDDDAANKENHTRDEEKVSNMIAFIEQDNLESVSGEWVLARFSDVQGAQWFLCALELGSTDTFHGRRISSDKIDFDNAIPEPGLLNVWQKYMERSKSKLCDILMNFLKSMTMGSARGEILGREHEHDESESALSHALEVGMAAVQNAPQMAVLTLGEQFLKLKGNFSYKHLSAAVLMYTPRRLQPAVENLNADKDFHPAMFHSGRRIHMF